MENPHWHHFGIDNASFINANVFNQNQQRPLEPADILNNARAVEATHTSRTASYAPKCHPNTRKQIIADIVNWVVATSETTPPQKPILWFPGPAGGGKTCIMRNFVIRCEETELLVASYFFSSRVHGLNHEAPFIATIAHQLSVSDSALDAPILEAIRRRPTLFNESLDLQLDKLIIEPLRSSPRKALIAIDGLDECKVKAERDHLLGLLLHLVTTLPQRFIVVIASRPELDIRTAFSRLAFQTVTHVLRLETYNGMQDIRNFVCDEFEKIRTTHPMASSLSRDSPLEDVVNTFVHKSSGNFIVPSVAMKYIANPRRSPIMSLQEVLALWKPSPPGSSTNPLAELDTLYTFILHPPETDIAVMKRILHHIMAGTCAPSSLDTFLLFAPGTTQLTLCDLHSVLSIPKKDTDNIFFHHKTLEDYLLNSGRSHDLFQPQCITHLDYVVFLSYHLQEWANKPEVTFPQHLRNPGRRWGNALTLAFQGESNKVTLPSSLLNFDPRIIWKWECLQLGSAMDMSPKYQRDIHLVGCKARSCVPLCINLKRMAGKNVEDFRRPELPMEQRQQLISEICVRSGLYDPTDPLLLQYPIPSCGLSPWAMSASKASIDLKTGPSLCFLQEVVLIMSICPALGMLGAALSTVEFWEGYCQAGAIPFRKLLIHDT